MAWTRALTLLAWMVLAGGVQPAAAEMRCGPENAAGVRRCSAELSGELVRRMQATQQRSQWCWAAAVEMVFARYGHAVPQAEIVERMYGEGHDLPIRTRYIGEMVGRTWLDQEGQWFSAAATPIPVARPTLAGQRRLLQTLADDHPLLLVARNHVVVLVGLDFEQQGSAGAIRVTGGRVLDPAPGQGLRALMPEEATPAWLAQVRVRARRAHFTSVAELNDPPRPDAPAEGFEASRQWRDTVARSEAGADALNGRAGPASR